MLERLKWAREEHGDFLLLALLFVAFRLFSLLLSRPGGFILEWSGYYIPQQGFIHLSDRGLYPFLHYWMEYPPLYPWVAVLAYRVSLLIPPWVDPRLWFNLIFGAILLLFEIGNFILVYALAQKLYGQRRAIRCAWFYALLFVPLFTLMGWFDSFSLFFLLLGLYFVISRRAALSGLATGVGFMIKPFPLLVAPLALRALPKTSQKVIYVGIAFLAAFFIATPFLLINAPLLMASFVNMAIRSPWESVWALMEGFYGGGATVPLSDRFDPRMAKVAEYPSTLPWLWISLAFALFYLFIYTRPIDWKDGRKAIAFAAFTLIIFLLYSKGWSPQFLIYLLPFVVLLLPNLRGVIYALVLTIVNFVEFPVALVMLPEERWLMATAVLFRTALFMALSLECGSFLFPSPRLERVTRGTLIAFSLVALVGGPLVGLGALKAYRSQALIQEPYAEAISFLASEPPGAILFTERSLYLRFYPFLGRDKGLYLLEGGGRWDQRLQGVTEAYSSIWVIYAGGEKDREANAEVERWLSENAFPVATKWFPNCRLSRYSMGLLGPLYPLEANFEGQALLMGYALGQEMPSAGQMLHLELKWRALTSMETDYTVFVHLLDPSGHLVSQHDGQPVGGFDPTSSWAPGEEVSDRHGLPLAVPPGDYQLRVGLYDAQTGERLQILDEEGSPEGEGVLVGAVKVMGRGDKEP
ncbi:MAG: hypothetical protein ACE5LG_00405 [Anaerolineae bacterium]